MSIGYANFSNIQRGNEQVVQQLTGLGQQISGAIENHAATQAATTMLPIIRQQYATGMQKIASGDPSGNADVIQAAGLAGQNPLTAHWSNQMIGGMTQANENLRTNALLQGRLQGIAMKGDQMANLQTQRINASSDLLNQKGALQHDLINQRGAINSSLINQRNNANPLKTQQEYASLGKNYQAQADKAFAGSDANTYNANATKLADIAQKSAALTGTVATMPLTFQARQTLSKLQSSIDNEKDPAKIAEAQLAIRQINSNPSNLALTPDQQDTLKKAQEYLKKGVPIQSLQQRLQQHGLPPTLLQPQQQSGQNSQQSAQPTAQNTSVIPAVSGSEDEGSEDATTEDDADESD
jgi:hypothetical protein